MLCCGGDCGYAIVQDDEMIFSAHTNLLKNLMEVLAPKTLELYPPIFSDAEDIGFLRVTLRWPG